MAPAYEIEMVPVLDTDLGHRSQQTRTRVAARIATLALTPRPAGVEPARGRSGFYQIRAGDYRILYGIDHGAGVVTLVLIAHRREAYARMGQRLQAGDHTLER